MPIATRPAGKLKIPVKAPEPAPEFLTAELVRSTLEVFDVPLAQLTGHNSNPNEQDEATFDQLVEGIRKDGFDEPVIVVPNEAAPGTYIIVSGHHRRKAADVIGLKSVPCIIKKGWSEDKAKIELVRRNMLRGNLNPERFTALWVELKQKGYDDSILKAQMGFTREDAFKKVYKAIGKNLTPAQKKKLDEAKESITSVDGLSSVLNNIFKDHGSDLQHGFVVFSFAGKQHHYVECDSQLHKMMLKLEEDVRSKGGKLEDVFKSMLSAYDGATPKGKVK